MRIGGQCSGVKTGTSFSSPTIKWAAYLPPGRLGAGASQLWLSSWLGGPVRVGALAWPSRAHRGLSWAQGRKPQVCALDRPFPRSQERVRLGSLWRGARRARGARGTGPQSRGGVPCPGRWGRREEALGPPHGRQSSQLEPARRPPGAGPGKDCLATCLRMRPSQFEPQWRVCCGPGCFRCGANAGVVCSLAPLSLGAVGSRVYFILLFSSEGAKAAPRAGTWNPRLGHQPVSAQPEEIHLALRRP